MDPDGFADLLSIDDVDRLVTGGGLRYPALKLIVNGSKRDESAYTRRGTIGSVPLHDLVDPDSVHQGFTEGATIVFNSAHRYWPPLAQFCAELESTLTHPVQVNVYVTPAQARGLDFHWDTHDVFVLQCFGEKQWQVFGEGTHAPLKHQHRIGAVAPPGEPLISTALCAGDALYIPRGFMHGAETRTQASAHLTVGILSFTWVDALRPVIDRLEEDALARESLPVGFARDPTLLLPILAERLQALGETVGSVEPEALAAQMVERFSRRRSRSLSGTLAGAARLGPLTDQSMLIRRSSDRFELSANGDRAVLRTDTRELTAPAPLLEALRFALSGEPFAVCQLRPWLDERGRQVLARRLLREGVLAPAPN